MNWLRSKLSRKRGSTPEKSEFVRIWKYHRRFTKIEQLLLRDVSCEIRIKISASLIDPVHIARDIVRFVTSSTAEAKRDVNRMLLLEVVDILATYQPDDRDIVRLVLGTLYSLRRVVDREVFLFNHTNRAELDDVTRRKTAYMLRAVAGWRLPADEQWKPGMGAYFLDLPMTTTKDTVGSTQPILIYQALYHLQDAQLVLDILRCGVYPSCFYMWPICMHIDLCLLYHRNGIDHRSQLTIHTTLLRYFCRARHYIYPHVIVHGSDFFVGQLQQRAGDIDVDDLLLLTPEVLSLLPPDRCKHASSLKHQARLAIRQVLLRNDNLPRGIQQLKLPQVIRDYVNLLCD